MYRKTIALILLFCSCVYGIPDSATAVKVSTTARPANSTDCSKFDGDCKSCVAAKDVKCAFCTSTNKCLVYKTIADFDCQIGEYYINECFVSMKALVIGVSTVAGVLVLTSCIAIYCCCSRRKKQRYVWEEAQRERERETRRVQQEERKRERESKYDEIRKKYAIFKSGDPPYTRFDA